MAGKTCLAWRTGEYATQDRAKDAADLFLIFLQRPAIRDGGSPRRRACLMKRGCHAEITSVPLYHCLSLLPPSCLFEHIADRGKPVPSSAAWRGGAVACRPSVSSSGRQKDPFAMSQNSCNSSGVPMALPFLSEIANFIVFHRVNRFIIRFANQ